MTVREAGKRGGERVKAKYGTEFMKPLAAKVGRRPRKSMGPHFTRSLAKKAARSLNARRPNTLFQRSTGVTNGETHQRRA